MTSALSLAAIVVPLVVLGVAILLGFLWHRKLRKLLQQLKDIESRSGGSAMGASIGSSSEWARPPPSPRVQIDAEGAWGPSALRDMVIKERDRSTETVGDDWGLKALATEDPGELSASSAGTGQGMNKSRVSLPPPHDYEQPQLFGSTTSFGTKSSNYYSDSSAPEKEKIAIGCGGQRVLSKRYSRRPRNSGGNSPSEPHSPKPQKTRKVKKSFGIGLSDDISYHDSDSDDNARSFRPTYSSDPGHHRFSTGGSSMFLTVEPQQNLSSSSASPSSTPPHSDPSTLGRRNTEAGPRRSSGSKSRRQLPPSRDPSSHGSSYAHTSSYHALDSSFNGEPGSPAGTLPSGAAPSLASNSHPRLDSRHGSDSQSWELSCRSGSMEHFSQPPTTTTARHPSHPIAHPNPVLSPPPVSVPTFRPSPLASTPLMLSPESSSGGASPFASSHSPIQRPSMPSPQRLRSSYYTSADLYSDSEVIRSSQTPREERTSLLQRSPSIEPALLLGKQLVMGSSATSGREKERKKVRRLTLEEREALEAEARFPHPYERGMSWMEGAAADSRGSLPKSLELERAKLMLTNPDDSSAVNSTTASATPSRATSMEEQAPSRRL